MAPFEVNSLPLYEGLDPVKQLNEEPGSDADEQFDVLEEQFERRVHRAQQSVRKQGGSEEAVKRRKISALLKEASNHVELCREDFQAISDQERKETAMALAA